ncbi:MAG: SUMF1/EgtB/PvdO family nonheme iron enzyme [Atopobiaceae bacterium]|nr:SUMF1/EgtB/PvdO family nonheme iron enzyme [Atopobiaceae bacterium]
MNRRQFLMAGALAGGAMALAGRWTPRNAQTPQDDMSVSSSASEPATSLSQSSSEAVSNEHVETTEAPDVDDGLIRVSGGSFTMGSPADEPWRSDDELQHEVVVSDFFLSTTEVSQLDYNKHMGLDGGDPEIPIADVSWYDAVRYCNALSSEAGLTPVYEIDGENVCWNLSANGYRLPTEAEWEYACRAGTTGPFNLDHSLSADEANYYGHYPYEIEGNYFNQGALDVKPGVYRGEAIAPKSFEPNAWGFYDMHGNVAEWVWDRYGSYDTSSAQDPMGPESGAVRVNRGGGWNDFAKNLRSAYRASLTPTSSSPSVGFRLARSALLREAVVGGGETRAATGGEALVVYFSWSGNTRRIAQEVASQLGVEPVELVCEKPYSSDYNTCLDEAQRDQNQQARPALVTQIDDMSRYGTVYLGYPNWWASIPMPIATFLESNDFSGKEIRPFCSNGGGGFGQSVTAISKLAPDAHVGQGLSVYYTGGLDMPQQVADWLASVSAEVTAAGAAGADATDEAGAGGNASATEAANTRLQLSINGQVANLIWEDNESVAALKELVSDGGAREIQMSPHGGFEQVGSLGASLPSNDVQMTTEAGDVVLYSSNQIVLFYGSNTWAYTRLGKIVSPSADELAQVLGARGVSVTIELE